jgi:hypothetical protein
MDVGYAELQMALSTAAGGIDPEQALVVVLALTGFYAASLWQTAHHTARALERLPRPINAPRRRALACSHLYPHLVSLGLIRMLRADFHAVMLVNPTRRIEDKVASCA